METTLEGVGTVLIPNIAVTSWTPYLIALAVYFVVVFVAVRNGRTWSPALWLGLLGAGVLVRLFFALHMSPYIYDFNTFYAWSQGLVQYGIPHFYANTTFVDYPPGYMYVLDLLGHFHQSMVLMQGSSWSAFWMKTPAMLADLGIAAVLLVVGRARGHQGWLWATLFYLNPAVLLNASIWGQVDSVFTLLLLLALVLLARKRYVAAGVFYGIAILVKPQALLFGPVFLFAPLGHRPWVAWGKMAAAGVVAWGVGVWPFAVNQPWSWIFTLYRNTLESYKFYSVNAFNLPALFGGNWKAIAPGDALYSNLIIGLTVVAIGLLAWSARDRFGKGMPAMLGYLIVMVLFLCAFKMHERYLFPALALVPLLGIVLRDARWGLVYGLITVAQVVNVGLVYIQMLDNNAPIPHFQAAVAVSVVALLVALLFSLWIWARPRMEGRG
jgi:Gpi18-like mannosyltransferase